MTVRSPGISDVARGALPVESTSQTVRTNGHGTKTGVQYSTVQYRRRKRNGGEEPVSKHQIRSGTGREDGRGNAG